MTAMRLLLVVAVVLVSAVGCADRRKPIMPGTAQIPLKVWVVLGYTNTGGQEAIGGNSNRGCRLTQAQMTAVAQGLQSNATIFGPNPQFQWDGSFTIARDPSLLPFTARTRTYMEFQQNVVASYWETDHINVFFTGNVQGSGSAIGATLDPLAAQSTSVGLPYILVNDGGFTSASGTNPPVPSEHVLEHEMGHYLARFTARTFTVPAPARTYSSSEHVPLGTNNLFEPISPPPLVVYGRYDQAGTEKYEIWQRIISGNWNNP
jgi:hypothetical protein